MRLHASCRGVPHLFRYSARGKGIRARSALHLPKLDADGPDEPTYAPQVTQNVADLQPVQCLRFEVFNSDSAKASCSRPRADSMKPFDEFWIIQIVEHVEAGEIVGSPRCRLNRTAASAATVRADQAKAAAWEAGGASRARCGSQGRKS